VSERRLQLQLGIGACLASAFLVFVAIPTWVATPSNIKNVFLSPVFWPYVLAGCTGVVGLGLITAGARMAEAPAEERADAHDEGMGAWVRLLGMALIMVMTMYLLPRLGMVWTSMLCFAMTAFLVKTRHPVAAMICAVVIPLALYAFFAHVAGVAIPQGDFVRLP
jgi:hypothetical protein